MSLDVARAYVLAIKDELNAMGEVIDEVMDNSVSEVGETDEERAERQQRRDAAITKMTENQGRKARSWADYGLALAGGVVAGGVTAAKAAGVAALTTSGAGAAALAVGSLVSYVLHKGIQKLREMGFHPSVWAKTLLKDMWDDPMWGSRMISKFCVMRKLICDMVKRMLLSIITNQLQYDEEEATAYEKASLKDLSSKTSGFFKKVCITMLRGCLMDSNVQEGIKSGVVAGLQKTVEAVQDNAEIVSATVAAGAQYLPGGAILTPDRVKMLGKAVVGIGSTAGPAIQAGVSHASEMMLMEQSIKGNFEHFLTLLNFEDCGGILDLLCTVQTLMCRAHVNARSESLARRAAAGFAGPSQAVTRKAEAPKADPGADDRALSQQGAATAIVTYFHQAAGRFGGMIAYLAVLLWDALVSATKNFGCANTQSLFNVARVTISFPLSQKLVLPNPSNFLQRAIVRDVTGASSATIDTLRGTNDQHSNNGPYASYLIDSRRIADFPVSDQEQRYVITWDMIMLDKSDFTFVIQFWDTIVRSTPTSPQRQRPRADSGDDLFLLDDYGKVIAKCVKGRSSWVVKEYSAQRAAMVRPASIRPEIQDTIIRMPHRKLAYWYRINMMMWGSEVWCGKKYDEIEQQRQEAAKIDTAETSTYTALLFRTISDAAYKFDSYVRTSFKQIIEDLKKGGGIVNGHTFFDGHPEGASHVAHAIRTDALAMERLDKVKFVCREYADFNRYFAIREFEACLDEFLESSSFYDKLQVREIKQGMYEEVRNIITSEASTSQQSTPEAGTAQQGTSSSSSTPKADAPRPNRNIHDLIHSTKKKETVPETKAEVAPEKKKEAVAAEKKADEEKEATGEEDEDTDDEDDGEEEKDEL